MKQRVATEIVAVDVPVGLRLIGSSQVSEGHDLQTRCKYAQRSA
jgi:hypothetical protein